MFQTLPHFNFQRDIQWFLPQPVAAVSLTFVLKASVQTPTCLSPLYHHTMNNFKITTSLATNLEAIPYWALRLSLFDVN